MSDLSTLHFKLVSLLPKQSTAIDQYGSSGSDEPILPTGQSDFVAVSLISVPFLEAPPYRALSYSWGDENVRESIVVDGQIRSVTTNLESALRQRRYELDTPLNLWVDYLCINQNDEVERTIHVRAMREFYKRSELVISWLGPMTDGGGCADLAMSFMQQFGHRAWKLNIGKTPDKQLAHLLNKTDADLRSLDDMGATEEFIVPLRSNLTREGNPEYERLIASLKDILARPYWSRMWIVQEVTVASEVRFQCGSEFVSENAFHHGLRLLRNFRMWQSRQLQRETGVDPSLLSSPGEEVAEASALAAHSDGNALLIDTNPRRPIELLKIRRATGPLAMMYLLRRLATFKASDPKDRVFALLGIASDAGSLGLEIDYTKSTVQIYAELTKALVRAGYYDAFSWLARRSASRITGLPSWVVDWSLSYYHLPLQERTLDRSLKSNTQTELQPRFRASKGLSCQSVPAEDAIEAWDAPLKLLVVRIGKITATGDPDSNSTIGAWLSNLQTLLISHATEMAQDLRTDALWRTAVADQDVHQYGDKPRLTTELVQSLAQAFGKVDLDNLDSDKFIAAGYATYLNQAELVARGRRSFIMSDRFLAIGNQAVRNGDLVVITPGSDLPLIVRHRPNLVGYKLICEAYVHRFMDGEGAALDLPQVVINLN